MGDAVIKENGQLHIHPGFKVSQMFDMDEDTQFVLKPIKAAQFNGEVADRAMNLQNGMMKTQTDSVVRIQPPESISKEKSFNKRWLARDKNKAQLLQGLVNTGRSDFQVDVRESMQRPDITAQQAARMHRGFSVRTQGRSYVEPERFVNDRLDLSTEHNWNVTKTTREDHSTPWSEHRPAKDPGGNAQHALRKARACDGPSFPQRVRIQPGVRIPLQLEEARAGREPWFESRGETKTRTITTTKSMPRRPSCAKRSRTTLRGTTSST